MRRSAIALLVALCAVGGPMPSRGTPTPTPAPLRLVVHPSRAGRLSVEEVRAIFLKQRVLWSDGEPIVPINHEAGSAARERFSRRVFSADSRQLAGYWNQRYFEAGEFPPATLASEQAVLRFVAENRNAIGYVAGAAVPGDVAVVLVLE